VKCLKCQAENPQGNIFCRECGSKLLLSCPQCDTEVSLGDKYCGKCGQKLDESIETEEVVPEPEGERKHVTVLFTDLAGYTGMSGRLDPEEVKEIMGRLFGEVARIVTKYEGFIEKFVGDAAMALFGVPKAQEDDAIRAIKAAREIHDFVAGLSPELEPKIGQRLSMHSGINTGLVVTGEIDLEKGTHGVTGETISIASRLQHLAQTGEILVGQDTYRQAEGYFSFEELEPAEIKGKDYPVKVYKVLAQRESPVTVHRLSGLKADLIGRRVELAQLNDAIEKLREGKGSIFSIYGDAGTGKSRLVEEFKNSLDPSEIQWLECHAHAYAQNIPYFPLMDLLNRVFRIDESDPLEKVRSKIESIIGELIGKKEDVVPYIGSLYSIIYPEIDGVGPEMWRTRMQSLMQTVLSALAQKSPTVFFLEDLHWADLSFLELLRFNLLEVRQPAIVICTYRPHFTLFTAHQLKGIADIYREIRLQELSPSEAQDMLESLLKTTSIPADLTGLVREKAEGNPFYLEELVNSLIEAETLIRDNGGWKVARPLTAADISATLNGVIAGRLDHLERETKRILQEASVIGRAFLYEILRRVTEIQEQCDSNLRSLERLDLIRARSIQPDLEYIFKHAMTQEVAYNGLLKKDRQQIHRRIGLVMEDMFSDRLPEFYEALAFHYKEGRDSIKALHYLIKSGEKAYKRYSLDESHEYFREAYDIISKESLETEDNRKMLIDLLLRWGYVLNNRGDFSTIVNLFEPRVDLATSLGSNEKLGMFCARLGTALALMERWRDGYQYLSQSLRLGEEIGSEGVVCYACAFFTFVCSNMGLLDEAVEHGERVKDLEFLKSDEDLYRMAMHGTGMAYSFKGDCRKVHEVGEELLAFGQEKSNPRCISIGHTIIGYAYIADGQLMPAIDCFKTALKVSPDPTFSSFARLFLAICYLAVGELEEADRLLTNIFMFCDKTGSETFRHSAQFLKGLILIASGKMTNGVKMCEEVMDKTNRAGRRYFCALTEKLLGEVFSQIALRSNSVSISFIIKNLGFVIKNVPFAYKKAEDHYTKAINVAGEIGAKNILGQAYLGLGLLHKTKHNTKQAREEMQKALELFEKCRAEGYVKQAKQALSSLEQ
jgi:class 3 adenylate cyclase/tetratricopeptide (TPR) repeat protein